MTEYARTVDGAGNIYQWVDHESVMILDAVTGGPVRFGPNANSIGHFDDALKWVTQRIGWETRMVIVRLKSVRGFQVSEKP